MNPKQTQILMNRTLLAIKYASVDYWLSSVLKTINQYRQLQVVRVLGMDHWKMKDIWTKGKNG